MTGKLPESGHHWLVCGCGIALPPSTLAPALKLSRNTLVDRNAQTHTDTHTVYQGSRNLSACIRREASFRVSKFPSTDRGDTDRNHTTPYFSAKKVLRNHYHVCNMQFNVHRVLLPRTKHMLFFFPTQVGTLQKCLRTQKQHSRGICELGPSQAVWYERAYIYTARLGDARRRSVFLCVSVFHIVAWNRSKRTACPPFWASATRMGSTTKPVKIDSRGADVTQ